MNMPLVLLNRRRRGGAAAFTPSILFALSEPGVWYDPSDMSTLFQDAAGTTPVTAVEQSVGLVLDKSKGLVLGPELVTNGDFSSDTAWTKNGTPLPVISGGVASWSGTSNSFSLVQNMGLQTGKTYKVTFTVVTATSGVIFVKVNGGGTLSQSPNISSSGTYTYYLSSTSADGNLAFGVSSTFIGSIDNISVRELPGNHATQSTAASRPVLSARYNLLTSSENLTDAVWVVQAVTKPTATRIQETAATDTHWVAQANSVSGTVTFQAELKAAERTFGYIQLGTSGATIGCRAMVDLSAGTILSYSVIAGSGYTAVSSTITSVGDGWHRVTITARHATASNLNPYIGIALDGSTVSYAGNASNGILARNADLRVTNDGVNLPVYQRVNTSTDYDTTGFPPYLRFDGTDDFLVTNTITPGTDKAQVFAGVRKLSDAAPGLIAEFSATTSSNAGSFYISAPDIAAATNYGFRSGGNTRPVPTHVSGYTSPITSIVSSLMDIAGDTLTARINGGQVAQSTADQGTGNFLAYPLYIGRRGGTSSPFNGRLYSLIVRFGANLTAQQITDTETWVNSKTKAY